MGGLVEWGARLLPASIDTQQPLKGMENGFGQPTFDTACGETQVSIGVSVRLYVPQYIWMHTPRHPNGWGDCSQWIGK
jgi:hypothetical protein